MKSVSPARPVAIVSVHHALPMEADRSSSSHPISHRIGHVLDRPGCHPMLIGCSPDGLNARCGAFETPHRAMAYAPAGQSQTTKARFVAMEAGRKPLTRTIPGPYDPSEMRHFLETFLYREEAFLIDEISRLDPETGSIEAHMDTTRPLPFSRQQRTSAEHPAHVSGAELLMVTGCLGCLHAWFFHGCRWDEGWFGFGNRVHRADFKNLARIGPPLRLESRETRKRVGARRVVLRYEFHFWQNEKLVYFGDQTAMFFNQRE